MENAEILQGECKQDGRGLSPCSCYNLPRYCARPGSTATLPYVNCSICSYQDDQEIRSPARWIPSGKLLLIVDDFEGVQHPYRYLLGQEGFRVEFATDGQDAVDKALALQPDVIFMDVSLPVFDGWEATRRLRADERTKKIPVVMLTAFGLEAARDSCRRRRIRRHALQALQTRRDSCRGRPRFGLPLNQSEDSMIFDANGTSLGRSCEPGSSRWAPRNSGSSFHYFHLYCGCSLFDEIQLFSHGS